eukprot:TRINITY_DN3776_c0_g1_i1.p1 TRINITY_DN3776_c0_g1~~TRINITY_DN3776_c0_g1_i1.p1  ORF type:complete len:225 (-),score=46.88 TRINITY_DN3776_c0_g1_i1:234-908(-)
MASFTFKIVLLGESAVGKSSIILRYVQGTFNPEHVTTIQASFLTKKLNIDGTRLVLNIWDTAGQERYHGLGPLYYREANGAVLVYDITDQDTFVKVKNWVKELRRMLGQDIILALVGNKSDLERLRVVNNEEAESYSASVGAQHFLSSAKLNRGVNELFLDIATRMMTEAQSNPARAQKDGGLVLAPDNEKKGWLSMLVWYFSVGWYYGKKTTKFKTFGAETSL